MKFEKASKKCNCCGSEDIKLLMPQMDEFYDKVEAYIKHRFFKAYKCWDCRNSWWFVKNVD